MKRMCKILTAVTLTMQGAVLLLWGIFALMRWEIVWTYPVLTAAVFAVWTVSTSVCLCMAPCEKVSPLMAGLLLLGSTVMLFVLMTAANVWWLCAAVAASIVAVVRTIHPMVAKVIVGVMLSLVFLVLTAGLALGSMLSGLRHAEVVREVVSPDGRYTVRVTSLSSGALGGDTLVTVHETATQISLGIATAEKPPITLITEETYGDHEAMALTWEDADTITVVVDSELSYTKTVDISF